MKRSSNRLVVALVYAILLLATLLMVFALLALFIEDFANRLLVMSRCGCDYRRAGFVFLWSIPAYDRKPFPWQPTIG